MKLIIQALCAAFVLAAFELLAQEPGAPAIQSSASPGKGVPTMQEVQATGVGATEDEAFKQAVVDAVRQVVGTLVSAENVVNNEKVIKDEVLTLSNGFVEKVLNQEKTKLDDGTWQVKLKCIVRKGRLYGKLQEVKVPTIKFEGASLFADVVSQETVEKDLAALLGQAILGWNGSCYEAVCLSSKPEIIMKSADSATIRMSCRVTLRRAIYENQFLGKLTNMLDSIAVGKTDGPRTDGPLSRDVTAAVYKHGHKVVYVDGVPRGYVVDMPLLEAVCKKAGTRCFVNQHAGPFAGEGEEYMEVFAVFRDSADDCLFIRRLDRKRPEVDTAGTSDGRIFNISPKLRNDGHPSDARDFMFDAKLPLTSLSKITKIELHVHTTPDVDFTRNHLSAEAPGEFVYSSGRQPWKCLKPSENRDELRHSKDFYYLPTLQMTDQSLEFRSQTK